MRGVTLPLSLASLAALVAVTAEAADHQYAFGWDKRLRSEYGMTATYSCARTPFQAAGTPGFDPTTRQLLVAADVAHAVGAGVMRFSRDGSVSVDVDGVELETVKTQPGQRPVTSGIKYECDGTYTAQPDGQIAVEFPVCSVSAPQPGVTVTVGPLLLNGHFSKHSDAMVLSSVDGAMEKVASAVGGNVVQERERICIASFSLVELRGRNR